MREEYENRDFTSDVPVSRPRKRESDELVYMGGFAFSQERGIVVSARSVDDDWIKQLTEEFSG